MIFTADVRDWLKTKLAADYYYIGKLDNRRCRSVGVYQLSQSGAPLCGIGQDMSYEVLPVSVLLHWTNSADETERAARQLFEALRSARGQNINEHKIYHIDLLTPLPVFLGTDEKGVYEWVIELQLYYERK